MLSNPGQVVIRTEEHSLLTVHASTVHHREIPRSAVRVSRRRMPWRGWRKCWPGPSTMRRATGGGSLSNARLPTSGLTPRDETDNGEAIFSRLAVHLGAWVESEP